MKYEVFSEIALVFDKFPLNSFHDINALMFFQILLEKYLISLHNHACTASLPIFIIDGNIKEFFVIN